MRVVIETACSRTDISESGDEEVDHGELGRLLARTLDGHDWPRVLLTLANAINHSRGYDFSRDADTALIEAAGEYIDFWERHDADMRSGS